MTRFSDVGYLAANAELPQGDIVQLPSELRDTGCVEYFRDYEEGRYDEDNQVWLVLPKSDVYISQLSFGLVIGHPGVDGIELCFRPGHSGVWAFYPISGEWMLVADTLQDLETKWDADTIRL